MFVYWWCTPVVHNGTYYNCGKYRILLPLIELCTLLSLYSLISVQDIYIYIYKYVVQCKNTILYYELAGVAGKFPPHYMGGMMSGQALGGIFPALVNILVIAVQVCCGLFFIIFNPFL